LKALEDFKNTIHSPEELRKICQALSLSLEFDFGCDKIGILTALSGVETSSGKDNVPRFESVFAPGGKYFNKEMEKLYRLYGAYASCSYGPWQIMAVKAAELGYEGHPMRLWDGRVSGPLVVRNLNRIFKSGAKTLEEILDAYNTGSFRVGEPPKAYIAKFWTCYGKYMDQKLEQ
jgi:hypothetical protein